MNINLPVVAASMVMGSLMLVFCSWKFFDDYIKFSTVLFPPETTFGDIYTVVIQMICHAAAIITATVQILSAFEFIKQTQLKEDESVEAFQTWFGTLINLFLLNTMIFLLIAAMNWSQTDEKLHTQPTAIGVNIFFMLVIFFVNCCIPCNGRSPPNIMEVNPPVMTLTVADTVNEKGAKLEKPIVISTSSS